MTGIRNLLPRIDSVPCCVVERFFHYLELRTYDLYDHPILYDIIIQKVLVYVLCFWFRVSEKAFPRWIKKEDDPLNHSELVFRIIQRRCTNKFLRRTGKVSIISTPMLSQVPTTTKLFVCCSELVPAYLCMYDTNTKDDLTEVYCDSPLFWIEMEQHHNSYVRHRPSLET